MKRLKSNQVRYTFSKTAVSTAFSYALKEGVQVYLWLYERRGRLRVHKPGMVHGQWRVTTLAEIDSPAPKSHSKVSDEMLASAGFGAVGIPVEISTLREAYNNESRLAVTASIEKSKGGKCWDFYEVVFTYWKRPSEGNEQEVAK